MRTLHYIYWYLSDILILLFMTIFLLFLQKVVALTEERKKEIFKQCGPNPEMEKGKIYMCLISLDIGFPF